MVSNLSTGFVEAVTQRTLLPFIGAGFSKNISPTLPNWSEVIAIAAKHLNYDPGILLSQGDYLQIAEFLHHRHKLNPLYNELSRLFDDPRMAVSASPPHILLPYLDVASIYTTNWDSWIERGFEHEGMPHSRVVLPHDLLNAHTSAPAIPAHARYSESERKDIRQRFAETAIYKFHGDFTEPSSIVFKERDYYDRLDFEHPMDIKLRSEIFGRSVLFIGYSFSDPNVRYVWHKLNKMMRLVSPHEAMTSYFVTHKDNPLQAELFKRKNIEIILLDPDDIGGELERLLEAIVDIQIAG